MAVVDENQQGGDDDGVASDEPDAGRTNAGVPASKVKVSLTRVPSCEAALHRFSFH